MYLISCISRKISLFLARFALAISDWRVSRMLKSIERLEGRIAREVDLRPKLVCRFRLAECHYTASVIERSQQPRRDRAVSRRTSRPCAIRVLSP